MLKTYPLLVCLVDSIQGVLDRDALEISCCYLHSEGEVQVNLFDRGVGERDLQDGRVFHGGRTLVDLPVSEISISNLLICQRTRRTNHPVFCVSIGSSISLPSASVADRLMI